MQLRTGNWIYLRFLSSLHNRTIAYPDLIRPTGFSEIADPFDAVVVALLKHFQEAHDKAGRREHEHLEIDVYRRPCPHLPVGGRRELSKTRECHLRSTLNAGDPGGRSVNTSSDNGGPGNVSLPDDDVLSRDVFRLTTGDLTIYIGRVQGRWYSQHHVGRRELACEVGLDGDDI